MDLLFRALFSEEIRAYEQAVIKSRDDATREIRKIRDEADRETRLCKAMEQAFSDFPGGKIVGIKKNKSGSSLAAFEVLSGTDLDIYLYGLSYNTINSHPRILSKIEDGGGATANRNLFIEDIYEIDGNCGNGSILMSCLIQEAKVLKLESIHGELAFTDRDHFDRLGHFYSKHGFTVSFNEAKSRGTIKLEL